MLGRRGNNGKLFIMTAIFVCLYSCELTSVSSAKTGNFIGIVTHFV